MLSAIVLLTASAGCEKDTKNPEELSHVQQNITAQTGQRENTAYKSERVALPQQGEFFNGLVQLKENRYLVTTSDNSHIYYSETNGDFSQYNPVSPEIPEQCSADSVNTFELLPQQDGTIYALVTNVTHGGLEAPDEFDENFDYTAYENAAYKQIFLMHYDRDFKIISCTLMDSLTDFVNKSLNNFKSSA